MKIKILWIDKVFEFGLRRSFSSVYIIGLYFVYSKLIYCIPFQLLVLRTTLYNSRKSVSSRIFVWKDCLHLKSFIFIASVWSRVWSAEVHKKAKLHWIFKRKLFMIKSFVDLCRWHCKCCKPKLFIESFCAKCVGWHLYF